MPREVLSPEVARLEAGRLNVRERLRWLAPNARRAKELAAEQRRLTIAALRAEVAGEAEAPARLAPPSTGFAGSPPPLAGEDQKERRPRFWWVEQDS